MRGQGHSVAHTGLDAVMVVGWDVQSQTHAGLGSDDLVGSKQVLIETQTGLDDDVVTGYGECESY